MFQHTNRQVAINLFSAHNLPTNEDSRIDLFLALPFLCYQGIPRCIYNDRPDYKDRSRPWKPCHRPLHDHSKLCNAFQHFHLTAGDPLPKEGDPELLRAFERFFAEAFCEVHSDAEKVKEAGKLAKRFFQVFEMWRREYVATIAKDPEDTDSENVMPEPPPWRFSTIWRKNVGSLKKKGKKRERSASPAGERQRMLRHMASAPDMKDRRVSTFSMRASMEGWGRGDGDVESGKRVSRVPGLTSVVNLVAKI